MNGEESAESRASAVDHEQTPVPREGEQPSVPREEERDEPGEQTQEPRPGPAPEQSPAPGRPPALRRLFRSRTALAVTAAGLVGALLGAGAVAWRTDTLPLLGPAPCWDSLGDTTMSDLFGDRRTVVEEESLKASPRGQGPSFGQCRITSYKNGNPRRQVTLRVHELDGLRGTDAHEWPQEFLAAGMVSLGDGLPGMTSASRAWLALPQTCTGRHGFTGPTVVDIGMGLAGLDGGSEYDRRDRTALTRAVVEATNGVIREFGCSGTYRIPRSLPALVDRQESETDSFCGVKGLTVPAAYREALSRTRVSDDRGPARVCEASGGYEPVVRMTTVTDPALTEIFSGETRKAGLPLKGSKGFGRLDGSRAVYRASCQTGPVIFMVEQLGRPTDKDIDLTRRLLPGYVAAEAERIGCGPEKVTSPSV
ncbi:hypothetical protein ACFC0C_11005 [Streptomyces sp. NPDC056178]|uniref:hypothetical protein n=1 Tax=Streptomyces sp. NPDC056178 TaxID=3345735 RepID=UPI0035DB77C9